MKNHIRISMVFILISLFSISGIRVRCQTDPPQLPDQHGVNGDSHSADAPVEDGAGLLLLLGFLYGAGKSYM